MSHHSVLWRRLDAAGHDACRFSGLESGCEIDGTAVFAHNGTPARLSYRLICDRSWHTLRGSVRGFVGTGDVDLTIERTPDGTWEMNGEAAPGYESYRHLDFAFTPATNFPHLQQLALAVGQAADLPVVWLDFPLTGLQILPQRYERRTESTYWYEAPTVGYAALLEITSAGVVRRYPGLWEIEDYVSG